jgi:uncharacterized membrane protein YkvA (DUF1232 family)
MTAKYELKPLSQHDLDTKYSKFQKYYSEESFWARVKRHARRLGKKGLTHALVLYYTLQEPNTPTWVKTAIIGVLGYLIFPIDAIPDFIPIVGFTDDLALLAAAIATLELNIPVIAREKAQLKMQEWFRQVLETPRAGAEGWEK